ncbi:F-box protein At5g49610-like [Tasmannia lanceolata]|uniref:F-box protein At5g49610-like n=1 Tax=Tasmannia lanceolata TaxID=3420 RepID=UPI004063CD7C
MEGDGSNDGNRPRFLCEGVIFEILTRVSSESLWPCRWVCKEWRKLTYESNFNHHHCERTQTLSGFFIQESFKCNYSSSFISIDHSPTIPKPSLNFLPEKVKIEASSSKGLLCCVNQEVIRHRCYYVCKPTTQQWRKIPNPKNRYFAVRMAMFVQSSNPLRYKIVRFSQPVKMIKNYLRCEIFDSSNWAWKRSGDIGLPPLVGLPPGPGVLINGIFHWLTSENLIFAFDINYETNRMIRLQQEEPDLNNDFRVHKILADCKGRLSVIYITDHRMEQWVMTKYSKELWKKKHSVNLEALKSEECSSVMEALYTAEVALMTSINKVIWYNFQKNKAVVDRVKHFLASEKAFSFQSDLVPCNMRTE